MPWTKFCAQIWEWMLSTYLIFFYTHLLLLWSRKNPFETIGLEYDESGKLCENCSRDQVKHKLNQTLWPDHCVMNTNGAKIKESVSIKDSDIDIRKGFNCEVSYLVIGEKWYNENQKFLCLHIFLSDEFHFLRNQFHSSYWYINSWYRLITISF